MPTLTVPPPDSRPPGRSRRNRWFCFALGTVASLLPGPAHAHSTPPAEPTASSPVRAASSALPDALATREQRTRERPDDAETWIQYGDALMQHSRDRPGESWYAQAEAAYQRALDLEPRHAGARVGLAWVYNSRHDFTAGCRWARAALDVNPRLPEAFALLGDAAVEAGDYDEAFEHYQVCLDLRPDLSAYARAAHLLWMTGDARRAKALLHKAINAGSVHAENLAWCRAELALMSFRSGALVPAEKQLEAALAQTPGNPHLLAALGQIKMARKDYPKAIELYRNSLDALPQHSTLAALTELHALNGEPEQSAAMFARTRAFHHDHDHAAHHHHDSPGHDARPEDTPHVHGNADLARFLADQNRDLAEAVREAEAAYARFKSVPVTDTLAWCYYRSGRIADAQRIILQALRWKTPDATILFHAGMIHAASGDRLAAQRYLYQALNLNPHFHPVHAQTAADTLTELSGALAAQRGRTTAATGAPDRTEPAPP